MRFRYPLSVFRDDAGNIALIGAIIGAVLVGLVFGTVDLNRASKAKQQLQASLDAATLYAARTTATASSDLQTIGANALKANLVNMTDGNLTTAVFTGSADGTAVSGEASAAVNTSILGLFGQATLPVSAKAEVRRAAKHVEVALILDTTGSMQGQKIIDLRAAAEELVDIVVKDQQTPYYSKVAIAPYSIAVNAGAYAVQARGAITAPKAITGATKANPVLITSNAHGFVNNNKVYIRSVNGMTQLNNRLFTVKRKTANTFELTGVDGRSYSTYTSSGSAFCTTLGCEYYNFTDALGGSKTFQVSTCVTERTGGTAYTDAAPTGAPLGRNYPSPDNPCATSPFSPLSSDKTAIKNSIDDLSASGSTGGHIGVAWGWYLISPNFAYMFPTASKPALYTKPDLLKAVILMTDGEYNSSYCNGVISKDSTSGSGATSDHINCNAPNGHAFDQTQSLCAQMKTAGVVVYTVGFNVVNDQRAKDLVSQCATSPAHVYLPSGGQALKDAFRSIGQDIASLRIAQ